MGAMASQITITPLFTRQVNQEQIKENMKAPRHWPLLGNSPVNGEFPAQLASNAENVSIWWRHQGIRVFSSPITASRGDPYCSSVYRLKVSLDLLWKRRKLSSTHYVFDIQTEILHFVWRKVIEAAFKVALFITWETWIDVIFYL